MADSLLFPFVCCTRGRHGEQGLMGGSVLMTMLEGQYCDRPLAYIRCWWVAADQMMSEAATMPVQDMELAGAERSLMLVMIIHSQSPHMKISAAESCQLSRWLRVIMEAVCVHIS